MKQPATFPPPPPPHPQAPAREQDTPPTAPKALAREWSAPHVPARERSEPKQSQSKVSLIKKSPDCQCCRSANPEPVMIGTPNDPLMENKTLAQFQQRSLEEIKSGANTQASKSAGRGAEEANLSTAKANLSSEEAIYSQNWMKVATVSQRCERCVNHRRSEKRSGSSPAQGCGSVIPAAHLT